jgi:hypothetical protein
MEDFQPMDDSHLLVLGAIENDAAEIRDQMADALRRLDMINFPLAGARLAMAIDALDEELAGLSKIEALTELA